MKVCYYLIHMQFWMDTRGRYATMGRSRTPIVVFRTSWFWKYIQFNENCGNGWSGRLLFVLLIPVHL